jgi:hypothetical protein
LQKSSPDLHFVGICFPGFSWSPWLLYTTASSHTAVPVRLDKVATDFAPILCAADAATRPDSHKYVAPSFFRFSLHPSSFILHPYRMRLSLLAALSLTLLEPPASSRAQLTNGLLKTRAELSDYHETSRYTDVVAFCEQLQKSSPLVRLRTFGRSYEGRDLPLLIISEPAVSTPSDARASGKTIVLLLANIHAGEVEGKEASLATARQLVQGGLRPLLGKLVVLVAPIYNADGNERMSLKNRSEQNGPVGGVGVRENAQDLDLNRDFMKAEAPETRALLRLFTEWGPHLIVDLHTTDGSFHGYHLTYSPPLNPSVEQALLDYHRERLLPDLTEAMLRGHGFRTYYYGNFASQESLARQSIFPGEPKGDPTQPKIWRTFSPQPRVGLNYVGLRNRLFILSEAYSYLDFRRRVEATAAFVEEILKYCAEHGPEIRQLTRQADARIAKAQGGAVRRIAVEYAPKALPKPVPILVGEVVKKTNPLSGAEMTAMVEDAVHPAEMLDYGLFAAKRSVPLPQAYVIPRDKALRPLVENLQTHGIQVEQLSKPLAARTEAFTIESVNHAARPVQGHKISSVAGHWVQQESRFEPGTYMVRTTQPLGLLAAFLLEPESDDGLLAWNFLDPFLQPGKAVPIHKLLP